MLPARHDDDDDDDDIYIYIYIKESAVNNLKWFARSAGAVDYSVCNSVEE